MKIYIKCDNELSVNLDTLSSKAKERFAETSRDANILEQLAMDENRDVRCEVATNPYTPVDVLELLAFDPAAAVRRELAQNPNITSDIVEILADTGDHWILQELAKRDVITRTIIDAIMKCEDNWPKERLLQNPAITREVAMEFLHDPKSREAAVRKFYINTLDDDTVEALVHDENENVRIALAGNLSTPYHALQELCNDSCKLVIYKLLNNPLVTSDMVRTIFSNWGNTDDILSHISRLKCTPTDILSKIADCCTDKWTLKGIAMNKNTTPETLTKLSKSSHAEIRLSVALNKNTPVEILKQYAQGDRSTKVMNAAKRRLNIR